MAANRAFHAGNVCHFRQWQTAIFIHSRNQKCWRSLPLAGHIAKDTRMTLQQFTCSVDQPALSLSPSLNCHNVV